jgi:ABC-type sugar transport system permease subunit
MENSVLFKPSFKKLILGLGPGLLIYGFMVLGPMAYAFGTSLYADRNFTFKFAGLQNYIDILKDYEFWHSFKNNPFCR